MKLIISLFLILFTLLVFGQDSTDINSSKPEKKFYEITELAKIATSDKYGFTGEFPVKVGTGKNGGPYNQRSYLELLRDGQGNPVQYKRVGGGCCAYKSANALFGDYALVDSYEVIYKDNEGNSKKTKIYISFYDYEDPLIPIGFSSSTTK